jgi:hypothetical protein
MWHLYDRLYLWLGQMEIPPERIRRTIPLWIMENKLIFDNAAALILNRPETNSLDQALDLYQELQGIPTNTQILNKLKGISWGDTN